LASETIWLSGFLFKRFAMRVGYSFVRGWGIGCLFLEDQKR
jgi:hypothetical protein